MSRCFFMAEESADYTDYVDKNRQMATKRHKKHKKFSSQVAGTAGSPLASSVFLLRLLCLFVAVFLIFVICVICGLFLHHRDSDTRWILLRMMHDVVRDDAGRFIVVVSASVQVSIEAREVTAGNLDANAMAGLEEIACIHRRETKLVNLARLHPSERFVVTVAITQTLDCLIQIVSTTVRIDVDQLHGEVRILHIGRNVECDFDRTA